MNATIVKLINRRLLLCASLVGLMGMSKEDVQLSAENQTRYGTVGERAGSVQFPRDFKQVWCQGSLVAPDLCQDPQNHEREYAMAAVTKSIHLSKFIRLIMRQSG